MSARHVPEPVGDRVEAACRELHEWWDNPNVPDSVRVQPRKDVSRALAAADAVATPPVVPDDVRRGADWFRFDAIAAISAPAQPSSPRQALEERAAAGDELAAPLWSGPAQPAPPVVPDEVSRVVLLAEELCDSVDAAAEDVGGVRGARDILREIGPIVSRLAAPAQPTEDAERTARIERCRAVLAERNHRIRELEEALEPFAKAAENYDDGYSRTQRLLASNRDNTALMVGDLQRARALLQGAGK